MSNREEFVCFPCGQWWFDTYSLWRGYVSPCPHCGRSCKAYCDTDVFADHQEAESVRRYETLYDAPCFDEFEKTEESLEAERGEIHDEIAESIAAVEADVGDDQDADSDGDGEGDTGDGR